MLNVIIKTIVKYFLILIKGYWNIFKWRWIPYLIYWFFVKFLIKNFLEANKLAENEYEK